MRLILKPQLRKLGPAFVAAILLLLSLAGCAGPRAGDREVEYGYKREAPTVAILRIEVQDVIYTGEIFGRSAWYVYRAKVREVISGDWTSPEVRFVSLQHAKFIKEVTQDCYVELRPATTALQARTGAPLVASKLLFSYLAWDRTEILLVRRTRRH